MSVRERILALKLLEKQRRQPELAKKLGVQITIKPTSESNIDK